MARNQRMGKVKRRVLILLAAGAALGLAQSPSKRRWILKQVPKELEKIKRKELYRAIRSLYESHLVEELEHNDGSFTFELSHQGKQKSLKFNLEKIKIKKLSKWDNKWRIAMFDIPEKKKRLREAIRFHLKQMGLLEYQKSVFISPYPCEDEVEFVLEYYSARRYIRFVLAEKLDNELHFMRKFKLC